MEKGIKLTINNQEIIIFGGLYNLFLDGKAIDETSGLLGIHGNFPSLRNNRPNFYFPKQPSFKKVFSLFKFFFFYFIYLFYLFIFFI